MSPKILVCVEGDWTMGVQQLTFCQKWGLDRVRSLGEWLESYISLPGPTLSFFFLDTLMGVYFPGHILELGPSCLGASWLWAQSSKYC